MKDLLNLNSAPNAAYSDKTIIYYLFNAGASQTSINQVSSLSVDDSSEGTIRYRLFDLDLDQIQESLNNQLKIHWMKIIHKKINTFAIDFVTIPYYGDEENEGGSIKTKPKQGTARFAYASIYVILRNKCYTLTVKYIRKGDTLKDTIDYLTNEIQNSGFKIKGLYLDREFYTVDVINYLQNREIPFIIPCVKIGSSGGIQKLFKGK
ncbi:MAG: hypothetical protein LBT10_03085 [Methanobrevibacter sp.]|jgi:putative transposase|nr:hypothetical protein [Methanobrevibacter sp.]